MKKVLGWSAKFPICKKIKTRNYSRLNKLQNAKNRNVLVPNASAEAFQRVTDETLQESHLKFRKSLAPRTKHKIFEFKKMNNTELWKTE